MKHRNNTPPHITEFNGCDDKPPENYEEEKNGGREEAQLNKLPNRNLHQIHVLQVGGDT
jgi:hypothetical protein